MVWEMFCKYLKEFGGENVLSDGHHTCDNFYVLIAFLFSVGLCHSLVTMLCL